MENIILSLEATCDLPNELIKKYNLNVIDMDFVIDDNIYNTAENDVVSSQLYQKMKHGAKTSTSQINSTIYEDFFKKLLEKNNTIIHLAFSSGLSNTYHSAKEVADKLNKTNQNKIYVIDTLCACSGQGYLAILARLYADKRHNAQEVVKYVENLKTHIFHGFTVDNLKYLANGGRLKTSTAFLGNVLNIKPVMKMDIDGKLAVYKKVISRKKSLQEIVDKFKQIVDLDKCKFCFISHADCEDDALYMKQLIEEFCDVKVIITNLGAVIGSHSGPGTIALYYIANEIR